MALKQIIIETFDDVYTDDLHDPNMGFAGTTAMTIITHLYDSFEKTSVADLAKIDKDILTPYDYSLTITKLFSQIKEVAAYARAKKFPFTPLQIIKKAFLLILKPGIFGEDYRSLNHRVPVEHTCTNFKSHFKLAYTSLREAQLAAEGSIYHGANATFHHK